MGGNVLGLSLRWDTDVLPVQNIIEADVAELRNAETEHM
jgi:hypothetical protein